MAVLGAFLATLLISFALTLLAAGLSGAYFGQGRSRRLGFVLAILALLLIGLFAALTWPIVPGLDPIFDGRAVGRSLLAVVAALAGFALALAFFVSAVMRS